MLNKVIESIKSRVSNDALLWVGLTMLIVPACLGISKPSSEATVQACQLSRHPSVCEAAVAVAANPEDQFYQHAFGVAVCQTLESEKQARCIAIVNASVPALNAAIGQLKEMQEKEEVKDASD